MTTPCTESGWTLERADEATFDTLMAWFVSGEDVVVWGGPNFRFPFTPQTFREDCHWPEMASFRLCDPDGRFCGFGQVYDRNGRINLARLVVEPSRRSQGIGRRLITMLMSAGSDLLQLDEFSLFVLRNNHAALACYLSLGFEISEYPEDEILADICFYMTRPVDAPVA